MSISNKLKFPNFKANLDVDVRTLFGLPPEKAAPKPQASVAELAQKRVQTEFAKMASLHGPALEQARRNFIESLQTYNAATGAHQASQIASLESPFISTPELIRQSSVIQTSMQRDMILNARDQAQKLANDAQELWGTSTQNDRELHAHFEEVARKLTRALQQFDAGDADAAFAIYRRVVNENEAHMGWMARDIRHSEQLKNGAKIGLTAAAGFAAVLMTDGAALALMGPDAVAALSGSARLGMLAANGAVFSTAHRALEKQILHIPFWRKDGVAANAIDLGIDIGRTAALMGTLKVVGEGASALLPIVKTEPALAALRNFGAEISGFNSFDIAMGSDPRETFALHHQLDQLSFLLGLRAANGAVSGAFSGVKGMKEMYQSMTQSITNNRRLAQLSLLPLSAMGLFAVPSGEGVGRLHDSKMALRDQWQREYQHARSIKVTMFTAVPGMLSFLGAQWAELGVATSIGITLGIVSAVAGVFYAKNASTRDLFFLKKMNELVKRGDAETILLVEKLINNYGHNKKIEADMIHEFVCALKQANTPESTAALIRTLAGKVLHCMTLFEAAIILGTRRVSSAIPQLEVWANHRDANNPLARDLSRAAAWALGEINTPESTAAIIRMTHGRIPLGTGIEVAKILGNRQVSSAIPKLEEWGRYADGYNNKLAEDLTLAAIRALGAINTPESTAALVRLLDVEGWTYQETYIEIINILGERRASGAIPILKAWANDYRRFHFAYVREKSRAAVRALEKINAGPRPLPGGQVIDIITDNITVLNDIPKGQFLRKSDGIDFILPLLPPTENPYDATKAFRTRLPQRPDMTPQQEPGPVQLHVPPSPPSSSPATFLETKGKADVARALHVTEDRVDTVLKQIVHNEHVGQIILGRCRRDPHFRDALANALDTFVRQGPLSVAVEALKIIERLRQPRALELL